MSLACSLIHVWSSCSSLNFSFSALSFSSYTSVFFAPLVVDVNTLDGVATFGDELLLLLSSAFTSRFRSDED